jgi:hypothetical protein
MRIEAIVWISGIEAGGFESTAVLAAGDDGLVKTLAYGVGQFVHLVALVELDGHFRRAQGNFTVLAPAEMFLHFHAGLGGNGIVDQFVEQCNKLGAVHFSPAFFFRK